MAKSPNFFPSICKRTCLISEISKFKNENQIDLCGRLTHFEREKKMGELTDWSGTIDLFFSAKSEKANKIQQGDIVQLTGSLTSRKLFDVKNISILVPFVGKNKSTILENNPRWNQLLEYKSKFELIRFRSDFLNTIRHFFLDQGFIEIDAPTLNLSAGMEPHIEPFVTRFQSKSKEDATNYFLHTSPEFVMKKMLVAGYGKIFYLGHTFRNEELSNLHNPEFTMLEWYRAYEDYSSLMKDCQDLIDYLKIKLKKKWQSVWRKDELLEETFQTNSLAKLMKKYCHFDLSLIGKRDTKKLLEIAQSNGLAYTNEGWSLDDLFFLLFLEFVEPNLGRMAPTIVKDYPIWMASLAKRKSQDPNFVERFELYIDGIELANAFTELNDSKEQYQRLLDEQKLREQLGRSKIPIDMDFIRALEVGMPPSAGIAFGVDRLMMVCTNQKQISDVVPFSFEE